LVERRLEHESGAARVFYAGLKGTVRVGIEATGHTPWRVAHSFAFFANEWGKVPSAQLDQVHSSQTLHRSTGSL
jgi:hypothetical protein